jgi:N6-adenosine-specific RNA methylase IME4
MRYRTIVADPPWPIRYSGGGYYRLNGRGLTSERLTPHRSLPYPTLAVDDIARLPVGELAEGDAHLYLWIPDEVLIEGVGATIVRAWGFEPGRVLVFWEKPGFGLGTFPRPQHEALICAKRGQLDYRIRWAGSVHRWRFTYVGGARQHSRKPEGAMDLIEQASPGPYVELFARRHRLGWDVWGNESANTATLEATS